MKRVHQTTAVKILPLEIWRTIWSFCGHARWFVLCKDWNEWTKEALAIQIRLQLSPVTCAVVDDPDLSMLPYIQSTADFLTTAKAFQQRRQAREAGLKFCCGFTMLCSIIGKIPIGVDGPLVVSPSLNTVYLLVMLPTAEYLLLRNEEYKKLLIRLGGFKLTCATLLENVILKHSERPIVSVRLSEVVLPTDWPVSLGKLPREIDLRERWHVFFRATYDSKTVLQFLNEKYRRDEAIKYARQLIIEDLQINS
jgi:hypothetical protein